MPDWSVKRWAARCVREIRRVQPSGPYHLAGHSLGGMVAWEAAHQLRAAGEEVAVLALIDTMCPWRHLDDTPPVPRPASAAMAWPGGLAPGQLLRRARRLALDSAMISMAGLHPQERKRQIRLFFRHGELVARRYRPAPWGGPTIVYRAETVDPGWKRFDWEPLLEGPWEERIVRGNHNSVLAEPNAAELTAHPVARLDDPSLIGADGSSRPVVEDRCRTHGARRRSLTRAG